MRMLNVAFCLLLLAAACGRTGAEDDASAAPCRESDVPTIRIGFGDAGGDTHDAAADTEDASMGGVQPDVLVDVPADVESPWWMRESYYATGAETWIISTDLDSTGSREVVETSPIPHQWHCRRGELGGCIVTRHYTRDGLFEFTIGATGGFLPEPGRDCQSLVGSRLRVFNSSMGRPASAAFPVTVEATRGPEGFCRFTIRRDAAESSAPSYQDYLNGMPVPWFLVVRSTEGVIGMMLAWDDGRYCSVDQGPMMFLGRHNTYYHMVCHGAVANRTVRVQFRGQGGISIAPCAPNTMGFPQGSVLVATTATGGLIGRELRAASTMPDREGWCTYVLER